MPGVETSSFDDHVLKARLGGRLILLGAPEEEFIMFWMEGYIQHK